jgi:hypothetical protein
LDLAGRIEAAIDEEVRVERRRHVAVIGATVLAATLLLGIVARAVSVSSRAETPEPDTAVFGVRDHAAAQPIIDARPPTASAPDAVTSPPSAEPSAEARRAVSAPPAQRRVKAPAKTTTALAELQLLRHAELSLRHDASAALRLLAEHHERFPTSETAVERTALTVLALCAAGEIERGRSDRDAFLREHPDSAYVPRVHRACAE